MTTLIESWQASIPSGWRWAKLSRVASMGTGHTPNRKRPELWENPRIPWVTAADLSRRSSAFEPLEETAQHVSELGVANSAAVVHPPGTVLLCRTASVGLYCQIGREMATTQAFVTWTAGPELFDRYLLYVVGAMAPEWERLAYGSTHLTIYFPDLEAIRVPVPPIEEQRRIADFLDDRVTRIDNIIRLREAQLAKLAELKNERLGEVISGIGWVGEQTLDDPLLGPVAADWPITSMKRVVRRIGVGLVVNPSTYVAGEGVPFLLGRNVRDGWFDLTTLNRMSPADSERLAASRLEAGDVVVVRAGYPGRAAVVTENLDGANCASVLVLKQPHRLLPELVAAFFNGPQGKAQVRLAQYGAAQEQINVGDVVNFRLPLPPRHTQFELVRRLQAHLHELEGAVSAMRHQVAVLLEYRQSLISAAVAGQFDVTTPRTEVPA